jgi:formylglycine-generating enzyme required for sulfatase activity
MIERANAAGGLGITLADMSIYGGNGEYKPATGITWNEAARFVNYLNTSHGYQAAYNFTTSGANDNITLWGAGQYSGSNPFRHKDAYYFLPSEDEWYKAAYRAPPYQGFAGRYSEFPTGTDYTPDATAGGGNIFQYNNQAVYNQISSVGPAEITLAGGVSPYGTIAQGGNVWEWIESAWDGSNDSASEARVIRGGDWDDTADYLKYYVRTYSDPSSGGYYNNGFRVASVPEPSSGLLVLLGLSAVLRRRRKRSGLAV